jgi:hypothetical protein
VLVEYATTTTTCTTTAINRISTVNNNIYENNQLQQAIYEKQSDEIILNILETDPESAKYKNAKGEYPLKYALHYERSQHIVTMIYNLHKEAVLENDRLVHFALYHCTKYEVFILQILDDYPQTASVKGSDCEYKPCYRYESADYKGPPREDDVENWFPLELSIENVRSDKVVLKILHAYPSATQVRVVWANDKSILQYAFEKERSDEVILALIDIIPKEFIESLENDDYPDLLYVAFPKTMLG